MATEWYYARNKKQLGPVSTARLKELAASGELQPTDKVWKEGIPKWVAAGSVAGLFPEGAAAPEEPDEAPPRRRKQAGGIPVWFWLAGAAVALLLVCGGGISVAVLLFSNAGGNLNFTFSS